MLKTERAQAPSLRQPCDLSYLCLCNEVHNPITLIKLDWKIQPNLIRVWTIRYDTVSGVLDFFYTSKFQSNISWVFGLTFQHGKVINRAVKFSTLPLLFLKWNNNKNFGWHLVFSINLLVIGLSNEKNISLTSMEKFALLLESIRLCKDPITEFWGKFDSISVILNRVILIVLATTYHNTLKSYDLNQNQRTHWNHAIWRLLKFV